MNMAGWSYRLSLQSKILLLLWGVTLSAVFGMTALTNRYYTKAVVTEFQNVAQEAATRLDYHLTSYFQQVIQSTHVIAADPLVQSWFRGEDLAKEGKLPQLQEVLGKYVLTGNTEIMQVILLANDNRMASTMNTFTLDEPLVKQEPWFNMLPSEKYRIIPTHLTQMPGRKEFPVLTLVVPVFDTSNIRLAGRLVLDIKLDEVDNILRSSQLGKTGVFFYLQGNQVVYYPGEPASWGKDLSSTKLAQWPLQSLESNRSKLKDWQDQRMLVAKIRSKIEDWNMYAAVPLEEMSGGLKAASRSTIIALIITTVSILIIAPLLARTLTRPIRRIMLLMRRVASGNLEVRASHHPGRDEVQQLNGSFNLMVDQLGGLIHTVTDLKTKQMQIELSQKEAVIRALNNQINPHLLYNTLDIIKSLAYFEQVPVIEQLTQNLADVYRYHANYAEREVSLSEEISHVRKYLEIVHVRFPIHFHSQIVVNDKFSNCQIVKLTLQPLVENAVKYAVEANGGRAAIVINAYEEKGDLLIEVADNGPGIPSNILAMLTQSLSDVQSDAEGRYLGREKLGLANVHARLFLHYGEPYGLTLNGFPERGTVVTIRVPLMTTEVQRFEKSIDD